MSVIRENEFMKVRLVTVESKEINEVAVLNKIHSYLSNNLIDGVRHSCNGFRKTNTSSILLDLRRTGDELYSAGEIDEDFESDKEWDAFCNGMKEILELKSFSVPHYYYAK
jgi:hypothetical protein